MLEISSRSFPSLLQPKSPANAFDIINPSLYNAIEINVDKTKSNKAIIRTIPTFERRYSILAPAVLKVSPTVPPTNGIICDARSFAALDVKLSALLAKRVCVDITVVNISIIIPIKKVNAFFIALLNGKMFVSPTKEDARANPKQTPTIDSNEIIHMFSIIDKKIIKP